MPASMMLNEGRFNSGTIGLGLLGAGEAHEGQEVDQVIRTDDSIVVLVEHAIVLRSAVKNTGAIVVQQVVGNLEESTALSDHQS